MMRALQNAAQAHKGGSSVLGTYPLVHRMLHSRRYFLPSLYRVQDYKGNHRQVIGCNKPLTSLSGQRFSCQPISAKDNNKLLQHTVQNKGIITCLSFTLHPRQNLSVLSALMHTGGTHGENNTKTGEEAVTDSQTKDDLVASIVTDIEKAQNVPKKVTDLRGKTLFWVDVLLDIGCTHKQIYHFITTNARLLTSAEDRVREVFGQFLYLNISKNRVMDLLSKFPEVLRRQAGDVDRRVQTLQKHVWSVENVATVILKCPQVLLLPLGRVRSVVAVLKDKCQFKSSQVQTILTSTPVVLLDTPEHAELLFQYVFFAMGATREEMVQTILTSTPVVLLDTPEHAELLFQYVFFAMGAMREEMVQSFLFRHKLEHIRSRHMFLERRGMYEPPDKKGKTKIQNPPLRDILATTTKEFLTQVAFASYDEYVTFVSLLEQESETDADTSDVSGSDSEATEEDTDGEGTNQETANK